MGLRALSDQMNEKGIILDPKHYQHFVDYLESSAKNAKILNDIESKAEKGIGDIPMK